MTIPRRVLALTLTAALSAPSPALAQVLARGAGASGLPSGAGGAPKGAAGVFSPQAPSFVPSLAGGLPAFEAPRAATYPPVPAIGATIPRVSALAVAPTAAAAKPAAGSSRVAAVKAAFEPVTDAAPDGTPAAGEAAPDAGAAAPAAAGDGRVVFDGASAGAGPLEALASAGEGRAGLSPAAPQRPARPVEAAAVPAPRAVYSPLVVSAAVAALSLAALALLGRGGWYGSTGQTALQYCEALHAGIVKQPANTYSNLGFIAVGLGIGAYSAWSAARDWAREKANRMRDSLVYPTLYAALATFLGPGSMAMHASTTVWGARVDVLSMVLWIAFAISYGLARLKNLTTRGFLAVYAAFAVALGAEVIADPIDGGLLFAMLVAALCAVEFAVYRSARAGGRYLWLAVTVAAYSLATAFWLPSHTGGPLCDPGSSLQGHAAWHLFGAVAVWALFAFYRSEKAR